MRIELLRLGEPSTWVVFKSEEKHTDAPMQIDQTSNTIEDTLIINKNQISAEEEDAKEYEIHTL